MSNASDCMGCTADVPEWMHLLGRAVAATSVADVARRLGVARSSLSLLINGKYPGSTSNMAARALPGLWRRPHKRIMRQPPQLPHANLKPFRTPPVADVPTLQPLE